MIKKILITFTLLLVLVLQSRYLKAQDKRSQLPGFISKKTYFDLNIGSINYSFTDKTLEPGFSVNSITTPHLAVRLVLLGYKFNKNLSAQISYMRPVWWVQFKDINGDVSSHSVVVNVSGISLKAGAPFNDKFSFYGEGGLALVSRTGFKKDNVPVVKDASYPSVLLGAGIQYHLNKKIDFRISTVISPANDKEKQPATKFFGAGVTYNMFPLSKEKVEANRNSGYFFPRNLIQIGFTTNGLGYGINNLVADRIFWGGDVEVKNGFTIHYQRNIFHLRKVFSVDWGTSFSHWKSRKLNEDFFTLSAFPVFRFSFLHTKSTDLYFNYSVAGPTYISKTTIDTTRTGKHFTFQDQMGIGLFTGKHRKLNAEIKIGHYSNGDIFPNNNGVKVPLTFNIGYTF